MHNFDYLNPTTLQQVTELLKSEHKGTVIFAGGTDILDRLKERLLKPRKVLNLKNIPELRELHKANGLKLGALITIAEIGNDPYIRQHYPALAQAAMSIATPQLRNMGTVGGNLAQRPRCWYFRGLEYRCLKKGGRKCFAVEGLNKYHAILGGGPCYIVHPSDLAPVLIAYGATINITGPSGSKELPLEQFFQLPSENLRGETILRADEVITHVSVPQLSPETRSIYLKFREMESHDFALSGVAAVLSFQGKTVMQARLVLSGVAPIPWQVPRAESLLAGKKLSSESIQAAADAAVEGNDPLPQNGYKVILTRNLVKRALEQIRG